MTDATRKAQDLYKYDGNDPSVIKALQSAFVAGAEWQAERGTIERVITDEEINRMAQYFYDASHMYYGITISSMTSKPDIVACLRSALERVGLIPTQSEEWTIAYLHQDCPRCENCADLAINSARAVGENSGSWQETVPGLGGEPTIGHRAVVERKI